MELIKEKLEQYIECRLDVKDYHNLHQKALGKLQNINTSIKSICKDRVSRMFRSITGTTYWEGFEAHILDSGEDIQFDICYDVNGDDQWIEVILTKELLEMNTAEFNVFMEEFDLNNQIKREEELKAKNQLVHDKAEASLFETYKALKKRFEPETL